MGIQRVEGDALIEQIGALFDKIRFYEFPRLYVDDVEDDGETYKALRCPRCGRLVEADDLVAVSPAEDWSRADDVDSDYAIDHGLIEFSGPGGAEWDSTLYYMHEEHAVSLPEDWREQWR